MDNVAYQTTDHGCGFAAIKTLLILLSGDKRYRYASEPLVSDAPNLAELLDYARGYGLALEGYAVTDKDSFLSAVKPPVLLLLREDGALHAVVLSKIRGRKARLLDPGRGARSVDLATLSALMEGIYLKPIGFLGEGTPAKKSPPFPFLRFLLCLCSLLQAPLLLGGFVLHQRFPGGGFLLPTLLLACLLSGIRKVLSLWLLSKFDRDCELSLYMGGEKERRIRYSHHCSYKRVLLLDLPGFAFVLTEIMALLAGLLYLNLALGLTALICLFLASLSYLGLGAYRLKLEARVAAGERSFYKGSDDLASLFKDSRKYGTVLLAESTLAQGLAVIGAVFRCLYEGLGVGELVFSWLVIAFALAEARHLVDFLLFAPSRRKEEAFYQVHLRGKGK